MLMHTLSRYSAATQEHLVGEYPAEPASSSCHAHLLARQDALFHIFLPHSHNTVPTDYFVRLQAGGLRVRAGPGQMSASTVQHLGMRVCKVISIIKHFEYLQVTACTNS
eukprot:1138403-Pelagomonas_calceolata.AAC.5